MKLSVSPTNVRRAEFVATFGGVYEHSPWIAEQAWEQGLDISHDNLEGLAELMSNIVNTAAKEQQLDLILAHPDLAGKAQIAGKLTDESTTEQSSAGLDQCSAEEYEQFQTLNRDYHEKFGFPFVMAVRDSSRADILASFERRLGNDQDVEFETALAEIHKIAALRLNALEAGQ